MFSLKALVVIGVAIIANVAFYGIVGCAVWGTFAGLGALLKLWTMGDFCGSRCPAETVDEQIVVGLCGRLTRRKGWVPRQVE